VQNRTADILEAAVREYIDSGLPISSGLLYEHYNFGIKPAMIRLELNELTDSGYLEQPHHSAGRVPRDKAFEFYARRALDDHGSRLPGKVLSELGSTRAWDLLAEYVSRELDTLSVLSEALSGVVYKEGLERLVSNLEWEDREALTDVIRDFESIDERLDDLGNNTDSVQVFIGKRSPVTRSEQLATLAARYPVGKSRVTIVAIGPKRMDYEKGARLLRSLYSVFN